MLKKIVIIGPESTGKSFLCRKLAEYFKTSWVPEHARTYLAANGSRYNYEDLYKIALGQLQDEDLVVAKMAQRKTADLNDHPVFIDTDLYVIKVWSEFLFNKCDNRILTGIANRHYDLYLLCKPDLPWIKDEFREYPDLQTREKLYNYYKDAMINQAIPWIEISGSSEERLQKAVDGITLNSKR